MTDTSLAAHKSIQTRAGVDRQRILEAITQRPVSGFTCDELEVELDLKHQTASARISELKFDGDIIDSGFRRPTRSNRDAIVYKLASPWQPL